jgi:flagellar biosynthetic protein FliQ
MEAKLIALGVETFKILGVVIVIILTMPWMLNSMIDFATNVFNMMPEFVE